MLKLVTAGLGLVQGIMGSRSAKKAARRKAEMIRRTTEYNAGVKEKEAESVKSVMEFETKRGAKSIYKAKAEQKVAASKDLANTPLEVLVDQASEMNTQLNSQRRNRLLQEQNLRQQAKVTRYTGEMQAQTAIAEGKAQARASLLGGISSAVSGIGSAMGGIKTAQSNNAYTQGSWWKY